MGDEYNLLNDLIETGPVDMQMILKTKLDMPINMKYLGYLQSWDGKMLNSPVSQMIREIAFTHGVNRVYNTNPEKYEKIWCELDPKYPQKRRISMKQIKKQTELSTQGYIK